MFARPNGLRENTEISFSRRGPGSARRKKEVYCTSNRVEEEEGAQEVLLWHADDTRTHIAGECELYKEQRNVLEEERSKIDGCDLERFGTIDSSVKAIAILGNRWRLQ